MIRYAAAGHSDCGLKAINEFKLLVREAHKLKIEVQMFASFWMAGNQLLHCDYNLLQSFFYHLWDYFSSEITSEGICAIVIFTSSDVSLMHLIIVASPKNDICQINSIPFDANVSFLDVLF